MPPQTQDEQNETDRQADAMKDQLRKDVASWSAARSGETPDPGTRHDTPAAAQHAPRAVRQKAKPVEPPKPAAATEKKPFKMSYDGTTDKDYIQQRIKLGAR